MDELLLEVRKELAEAEEIHAGRMARITLTNDEGSTRSFLMPFRVAAYARKAMGAPAALKDGTLRAVFTSRGITASLFPTVEGYIAISQAIIARNDAIIRRINRERAILKAKMRNNESRMRKGGAAL